MKIVERRGSNDLIFLVDLHAHIHNMFFFGRVEIDLQKNHLHSNIPHPFHCLPIAEFVLFAPRYVQRDAQGIQPAISRKKITSFAIFTGFFFVSLRYFFFSSNFLGRERMHHTYPVGSGQFEVSDGSGFQTGLPKEPLKEKVPPPYSFLSNTERRKDLGNHQQYLILATNRIRNHLIFPTNFVFSEPSKTPFFKPFACPRHGGIRCRIQNIHVVQRGFSNHDASSCLFSIAKRWRCKNTSRKCKSSLFPQPKKDIYSLYLDGFPPITQPQPQNHVLLRWFPRFRHPDSSQAAKRLLRKGGPACVRWELTLPKTSS